MESSHPHLTNQKLFYVILSRAKYKAKLITDDREKLIQTLWKQTGISISSIEHQQVEPPTAPPITKQYTNYNYSIGDVYNSLYDKIPRALPQFGFVNRGGYYVSSTGHKIDGSDGKAGKVYVYSNNPGVLVDYTRGNKSIWQYVKESSMPGANNAEMMKYLTDIAGLSSGERRVNLPRPEFQKIPVPRIEQKKPPVDKTLLRDIQRFATGNMFIKRADNKVLKYLQDERGYSDAIIKRMELGCITDKKYLGRYLRELNWSTEKIKEAYRTLGYIGKTHNLIIPYKDSVGQIIGFAGRNINYKSEDKLGKYMYTKGLSRSGSLLNIHKVNPQNSVVMVEGMFDALHSMARGIENVVSLGGTAFNHTQLQSLVDRGVKQITLCLDNDTAGREAAEKIIKLVANKNPEIIVNQVTLPNNIKDPDQMLRDYGVKELNTLIKSAENVRDIDKVRVNEQDKEL